MFYIPESTRREASGTARRALVHARDYTSTSDYQPTAQVIGGSSGASTSLLRERPTPNSTLPVPYAGTPCEIRSRSYLGRPTPRVDGANATNWALNILGVRKTYKQNAIET